MTQRFLCSGGIASRQVFRYKREFRLFETFGCVCGHYSVNQQLQPHIFWHATWHHGIANRSGRVVGGSSKIIIRNRTYNCTNVCHIQSFGCALKAEPFVFVGLYTGGILSTKIKKAREKAREREKDRKGSVRTLLTFCMYRM